MRRLALALFLLPLSTSAVLADPPSGWLQPGKGGVAANAAVVDTGNDNRRNFTLDKERPEEAVPQVVVVRPAARPRTAEAAEVSQPGRKRITKMPWMTGVYQ